MEATIIRNKYEAAKAVELMIAEMSEMWSGFQCNGKLAKGTFGYYKVAIIINGTEDAASLYLMNGEYVAIPDMYYGEGTEFKGSKGNYYFINADGELEAAA